MAGILDDPEYRTLIDYYTDKYQDTSSFNDFLSYTDESQDFDSIRLVFDARDEYLGNITYRILHGGIIAAMLDTAGGRMVWLTVFKQLTGQPLERKFKQMRKVGSINLRIDYLQPGHGKRFIATASILKFGKSFAVTRMELRNEKQKLIAVGTEAYTVGE